MTDLEFSFMCMLLLRYSREMDQHDAFVLRDGDSEAFVTIGLAPIDGAGADAYREIERVEG